MIKKFLTLFLSFLIIFAVLSGTGVYMLYAFKLLVNYNYALVISVVAIVMFSMYGILDTIKLRHLEEIIKSYIDSQLNSSNYEVSDLGLCDSKIDYSDLDLKELSYKTTDLTLYEYSLRAQFVEGNDPLSRMEAIALYLGSRIENRLDYGKVPLPIVLEMIKNCDDNIPESSKNIIYDGEQGTSSDSDVFDSLDDLDLNNLN